MSTQQQITESQILTSYLLTPSPLPTILPYSTFLTLLPSTYRNNPSYKSTLKRLYRDLQFQRDITLAQVQDNIERECGGKAATLRADLARRIAIEEGEVHDGDLERRRKRRRIERNDELASDNFDTDEDANEEPTEIKEEDSLSFSEDDEDKFFDPLRLQVQQTFYDDPTRIHPAANVLALPGGMLAERVKKGERGSKYHSRQSLLAAMEHASGNLENEISELEAECEELKGEVSETVGGLSDLRYGRASKNRDHTENGEGDGEYKDVLDALTRFREVLKQTSEG